MHTLIKPTHQPVRTVLHLSPAVTSAALTEAQRHQQGLAEWVERLVVDSCAAGHDHLERRLSELMSVELFAHVASNCPGAFVGRWRLLYDRCLLEPELWRYPVVTLDEAETAGTDLQPTLDAAELLRRWPALVASVWLVS